MDNDEANTSCEKKIVRRDVEKKRRQQMAILNASLRSELPLEMIQGKRSVSDHINEAVNYIKHLNNKIEELSIKRNKLKRLSDLSVLSLENESSDRNLLDRVILYPSWGAVEIIVISNVEEEALLLSKVLDILLEEGFSVVSCVSTKANERQIYTIQSEVNDSGCLDLPGLKRKLNDLISLSRLSSGTGLVSTYWEVLYGSEP